MSGVNDSPKAEDDNRHRLGGRPGAGDRALPGNDADPDASDDLEVTALDLTGTLGSVLIGGRRRGVVYDPNGAFEHLAAGESATDTFT